MNIILLTKLLVYYVFLYIILINFKLFKINNLSLNYLFLIMNIWKQL